MNDVTQPQRKAGTSAKVAAVIFALGIIGIFAGHGSGSGSGSQDTAKSNCHSAVKDQLRAPASAHFHDDSVDKGSDGFGYDVTGEVDSENGFGALLTSTYTCKTDSSGDIVGSPTVIGG